jgi:hypothetical protein
VAVTQLLILQWPLEPLVPAALLAVPLVPVVCVEVLVAPVEPAVELPAVPAVAPEHAATDEARRPQRPAWSHLRPIRAIVSERPAMGPSGRWCADHSPKAPVTSGRRSAAGSPGLSFF